jgi:RNA polymerase sigma-70 factor, ECF subfamily
MAQKNQRNPNRKSTMHPITVHKSPNQLGDADIVQRIAAGDGEALQIVMRRYNQMLYRTARSILKDDAEAEDAVQEAYLLAYRGISDFRGDAKLSTWLVRIVANEALARLRKRSRRVEVIRLHGEAGHPGQGPENSMADSSSAQPESIAVRSETRRLLETMIDQLPDVFRTVFVLRALEEMTVGETASILAIPEATVRTRYFRAKGMLREALAREIDFSYDDAFACAGARCDRIVAAVLQRLDDFSANKT